MDVDFLTLETEFADHESRNHPPSKHVLCQHQLIRINEYYGSEEKFLDLNLLSNQAKFFLLRVCVHSACSF